MKHPSDLAVAPDGSTVYITDTPNNAVAVAASAGSYFVYPMGLYGLGACNGGTPTSFASLYSPTGISIGPPDLTSGIPNSAGDDLYIADSGDKRILQINPVGGNTAPCGYYPGGVVEAILAGVGSPSGPVLNDPLSVVASGSNVYIADSPPAITNTSLGSGTIYENGVALTNANIVFPYSLATDAAGDLYYSDQSLSQVWRVDTQGNFLVVAGNGVNNSGSTCTSAAPCEATQTSILTPHGLSVSGNGSIFIGDAVATGQVGEVNVTTGMLTFPSQPTLTTSNPLTVTVTDTAAMTVGASGASIAGTDMGDFAILTGVSGGTCNTATGFALSPGHSCTILVTFTPGATGTRTAVINLTTQSEIYGGTQQQIELTGNGAPTGPAPQTISFPPPPRPMVYGAGSVVLSASASSGLPVSFSLVAGSTGGVLSGNILSFTGAGLARVLASQSGNGSYAAASSVEQDIAVLPATLIVTTPPATRIYEGPDPAFTDTVTGLVGGDTLANVLTGNPTFTVTLDLGDAPSGTNLTVQPGVGTLVLQSPNYVLSLVPSTLTVVCCEPQVITPASVLPGNFPLPIGIPLSLTGSASSGLPVIFTVVSGPGVINTLPAGITLTATGPGPITLQLTQPGNGNTGPAPGFTVTINGSLTITTPSLPEGAVGVQYPGATFMASGGIAPYTWSITGLPPGLNTHGVGDIYGTPTSTIGSPFNIVVVVTDSAGETATKTFPMTPLGPLAIAAPISLPVGALNGTYPTNTITASGGLGPFTWSATGLPPGLFLNNSTSASTYVYGSPTTDAGSPYTATITVSDSLGSTVSMPYTIQVLP